MGLGSNVLGNLVLRLGDHFGGGRGRRSTEIGYKVGDGEVGFMTYRGNDGKAARCDRASNALAVEGRQVFERSTAARQYDDVREARYVQFNQRRLNLRGGLVALDCDGAEQHVEAGVAAADDVEKVADHGAGGRSNNAHGAGKSGQRALAGRVEEAFGFEPLLELFKGQLKRTGTHRLHGLGHQLHLAALFIDAHPAAGQHVQAVFGAKAQQHGVAPEKDHRQLRVGVLEREVEMAGRCGAEVGDLALYPDVAVFPFDEFAHPSDQLAHRPDAACGQRLLKGEVELRRV